VQNVALAGSPAYCPSVENIQHTFQPDMYPHPTLNVSLWRGGISGWDPTPRYPDTKASKGNVENCDMSADEFVRSTEIRLRKLLCEAQGNSATYVLFAWNEWGEGSVLEPNSVDGSTALHGLRTAKKRALQAWRLDTASGLCRTWIEERALHATQIAQRACHQSVMMEMCDNNLPRFNTVFEFELACSKATDGALVQCCELYDKIRSIYDVSGQTTRLFGGLELGRTV
jgi:hypothetical protein